MGGVGSIISKGLGYLQRGAKVYGPAVFGSGQEAMGAAYKKAITTKNPLKGQFWKDVWTGTKAAGKAAETHAAAEKAAHGSFFKSSWNNITTIPKKIAQGWKVGGYKAAKAGKNVTWGKLTGAAKGIGKRMPVIGSLLISAFELPNIVKATANEGIVQGLAETAKAGARLGGATLLGALGTALGGPVGGIIGFMAGDWLTRKIVGESYSERKAKEQEQSAQQQAAQASQQTVGATNPFGTSTMTPQQLAMYQQMLYGGGNMNDDFMYNAYMKGLQSQAAQQLDYQA